MPKLHRAPQFAQVPAEAGAQLGLGLKTLGVLTRLYVYAAQERTYTLPGRVVLACAEHDVGHVDALQESGYLRRSDGGTAWVLTRQRRAFGPRDPLPRNKPPKWKNAPAGRTPMPEPGSKAGMILDLLQALPARLTDAIADPPRIATEIALSGEFAIVDLPYEIRKMGEWVTKTEKPIMNGEQFVRRWLRQALIFAARGGYGAQHARSVSAIQDDKVMVAAHKARQRATLPKAPTAAEVLSEAQALLAELGVSDAP